MAQLEQSIPMTIIVGAGPQGAIVLDILRARGVVVTGFVDDNPSRHGETISGVPVLGPRELLGTPLYATTRAFVAIGNNDVRCSISQELRCRGIELINVIHPSAILMSGVRLGSGVLICAGAVLVNGCLVENDAVVNTGATVDHNARIAAGAYIAPGVRTAGSIQVGEKAFVGLGALLAPGISIGAGSVIGMGSVVLSDIPAGVIAYGHPARIAREIRQPLDWKTILAGR